MISALNWRLLKPHPRRIGSERDKASAAKRDKLPRFWLPWQSLTSRERRDYKLTSQHSAFIIVNGNNVQEHEIEVIIAMEEGERRTRKIADFLPRLDEC
jgi:hypothetical protein